MKILLILTGKTTKEWITQGINYYYDKILHYINFEINTINITKPAGHLPDLIKNSEAEKQFKIIKKEDIVILLDENGKSMNSKNFALFIEKLMNTISNKRVVFIIGGAYGFSKKIIERANFKISLSAMTFSHQVVRILFMEQIYRAFTIINNEPYHHA